MAHVNPKPKRFCRHCSAYLSVPVYKKHKAEYYDCESNQWAKHDCDESGTYADLDAKDDSIIGDIVGYTSCSGKFALLHELYIIAVPPNW